MFVINELNLKVTDYIVTAAYIYTSSFAKKKPVDFDDELKIGNVRYDNLTKITIKVQLFWRLPYEM